MRGPICKRWLKAQTAANSPVRSRKSHSRSRNGRRSTRFSLHQGWRSADEGRGEHCIVVAAAKPAPVEFLRSKSATAAIRSNADFNIGAAGATLERDYFRAQEPDSRSGPSPLPIRAEHFCQGSARSVLPISQTFRSGNRWRSGTLQRQNRCCGGLCNIATSSR